MRQVGDGDAQVAHRRCLPVGLQFAESAGDRGTGAAGAYPVLDYATGGWIGGLMDATQKLIDMSDSDTIIVPGAGPAQSRDHLEEQVEMISTVRERVATLMRQGKSVEEMVAAGVTAEFDAAWGHNRDRFIANVYGGLWWQGRLDGSL